MAKPRKSKETAKGHTIHDSVFKDIYSDKKFSLDIFRLVLSPAEFRLFNWKGLKSEATVFVDPEGSSKQADLVFSAGLKNSKKRADIIFLLEHKAHQSGKLLQQILNYQTRIYGQRKNPIIPILVYQGPEKRWKGPLRFQDSLDGMTPTMERHFGRNVLDFTCRLLNLQDMASWRKRKDLTTSPILFTMASIWRLDYRLFEKFFELCKNIDDPETRGLLQEKGMEYANRHDSKKFSWKKIREIESKVMSEEERIMPLMQSTLELERERGEKEGKREGKRERDKEIALQMLEDGLSVDAICKYTGLTEKQVEALRPQKKAA